MTNPCQIDLNQLYSTLNNPITAANFLNPNAETDQIDTMWSIKITYNATQYEFNYYYVAESMEIVSTFGQRGLCSFALGDTKIEGSVMHFIPVEEMYVEIWDVGENYMFFAGYIQDVRQKMVGQRDDLTEAAEYHITCTDLYRELEIHEPINKVYENKTLGFILRDVINRYTSLDASEIDPDLGFEVVEYPVRAKTASQVLSHIQALTDTSYFIDPSTRKIYLTQKDSAEVRIGPNITDSNLYDYFNKDSFELRRQTDYVRTAIELWYTEKYNRGTVNVSDSINPNIVVGYGSPPDTEWDDLDFKGGQFKLKNGDALYSIEKNLSAGATQEIRLSSDYKEATGTNQEYEILGRRLPVRVYDTEAAGLMRQIRGGSGLVYHIVSEDENYFTQSEARRFAQAMLALSRPLPKGQADTDIQTFCYLPLFAGQTLNFNLPNSKRFVGTVVIQQVTIKDVGGVVWPDENRLGIHLPKCSIRLGFTATLNDIYAAMRKMMQDLRKVKVNISDPGDIVDTQLITETLVMQDCVHAHAAETITELLTLTDYLLSRTETAGPLFYTEQHYLLNEIDYAFSSD